MTLLVLPLNACDVSQNCDSPKSKSITPSGMSKQSEFYVKSNVCSTFSMLKHHILPVFKLGVLGKRYRSVDNGFGQ